MKCHDCGAKVGELHVPGCDNEPCPECGEQWISCEERECEETARPRIPHEDTSKKEQAAREFGFWDEEKDEPDFTSVRLRCDWDADAQKWVQVR